MGVYYSRLMISAIVELVVRIHSNTDFEWDVIEVRDGQRFAGVKELYQVGDKVALLQFDNPEANAIVPLTLLHPDGQLVFRVGEDITRLIGDSVNEIDNG